MGWDVAGEANPGKNAFPTTGTEVGRGCAVGAASSSLPHMAFLFCCMDTTSLFSCFLSYGDCDVPGRTVSTSISQLSGLMEKSVGETFRVFFL